MHTFALKGDVCYSRADRQLCISDHSYVICEDGICRGVYRHLPDKYQGIPCHDYTGRLILPGLTDLHVHASQYAFRGLGMDLELIDWLGTHTFAEEAKYADIGYAMRAYDIFVDDLINSATTRACIFGTIHTPATLYLMQKLEDAGFSAYVGRVNMDRNCPENLCEPDARTAAEDTRQWILESARFTHVRPILTPRFIPVCSDALMELLSGLQKQYQLPVQSHLSENTGEIAWVHRLCPDAAFYGAAYDRYGMFGSEGPAVMAHGVHSGQAEMRRMKENGVFLAHCPESNANLSSGIAPVRAFLDMGIRVGLGSDLAAGSSLSLFQAMAAAVRCSKLRWRLTDQSLAPLGMEEVFYMATRGGGEFFGKVGSFAAGYEFDAVVINDASIRHPQPLSVRERLERLIYLAQERHVEAKYIAGRKVMGRQYESI